ncbi:MAG: CPBP family intramembrane metalloprotease [Myxococcales bacterium]|nr:CPBP family intramembrane metalloprotease [Myxococcales bacterium]
MWTRLTAAIALALLLAGLGLGAKRVYGLERSEQSTESDLRSLEAWLQAPGSTRRSARLLRLSLQAGQSVLFEVCSDDRLEAPHFRDAFQLVVFELEPLQLMLKVPLDAAHLDPAQGALRRNADGACLQMGGGKVERSGRYSVDLVFAEAQPAPEVLASAWQARVLARRRLETGDLGYVMSIAAGLALFVGLLWLNRVETPTPKTPTVGSGPSAAGELLLLALATATVAGGTLLPLFGSTLALLKGALLMSAQVGLALLLCGAGRRTGLALVAPAKQPLGWLAAALAGAVALWLTAKLSLSLVPSTSEAPIQTFISWPSGMLAFGALGVLMPLGEEIFFRGYVYRATLRLGQAAAFGLTTLLFVAMHAQQSWGNWGGLLAIAITGTVLTALRALSGSTLVPAVAHLLYNFSLTVASF